MIILTSTALTIFFIELIIGGPGFWTLFGFSFRKLVFALCFFGLLLLTLGKQISLKKSDYIYLSFLALYLIAWMFIIPIFKGGNLSYSISDGLPLIYLAFALFLFNFYQNNYKVWRTQRIIIFFLLQAIALITILIWTIGTLYPSLNVPIQFVVNNYFSFGTASKVPSIYVGLMPDGFYRVLWITHIAFLPMLFLTLFYRKYLSTFIFAFAIFATYTRAFWLVLFVFIIFLLMRDILFRKKVFGKRVIFSASILFVFLIPVLGELFLILSNRLEALLFDASASIRVIQLDALLEGWQSAPLFGNGFGASVEYSRNSLLPYSYELTYVALLMKLGIVGFIILNGLFFYHINFFSRFSNKQICIVFGILSILSVSFTNPYLINFVGLGFISLLLIEYNYVEESEEFVFENKIS